MFTRGHNRLLEAIETNRTAIAANRDAINTNKGFTDATRARVGDLEKGVEGIKKDVQTLKDKTGGDSVSVEDHAELKAKVENQGRALAQRVTALENERRAEKEELEELKVCTNVRSLDSSAIELISISASISAVLCGYGGESCRLPPGLQVRPRPEGTLA
jgi:chromosome segregation ATPase